MELVNTLKIYTIDDEGKVVNFPEAKEDTLQVSSFEYNSKRMGGAPTITFKVKYPYSLDSKWSEKTYINFNGEKYYLKNTPSCSFDNTSLMYSHECTFVSERAKLDSVYFLNAVKDDTDADVKYVAKSTNFNVFCSISEFADRINLSLLCSNLQSIKSDKSIEGYHVVIDEGIDVESKLISFENKYISEALQEFYNTFEVPYYFNGKEIHVGFFENEISTPFEYGVDSSLLSITRNNANKDIVTRITGVGSSDNIPYYYPNPTEKGTIATVSNIKDADAVTVYNEQLFVQKVKEKQNVIFQKITVADPPALQVYIKNISEDLKEVTGEDGSYELKTEYNAKNDASPLKSTVTVKQEFTPTGSGELRIVFTKLSSDVILPIIGMALYKISTTNNHEVKLVGLSTPELVGNYLDCGFIKEEKGVKYRFEAIMDYTSYHEPLTTRESFSVEFKSEGRWIIDGESQPIKDLSELGVSVTCTPENGNYILYEVTQYIQPQPNLMPPIYRESGTFFYNAVDSDEYTYINKYNEGHPYEYIKNFEEIRPTIENTGYDIFESFAYDNNDSDDTIVEGDNIVYKHPYFFGKLKKLDFNLFDHASESGEMTISMKDGLCGGCKFVIAVSSSSQKNVVQVDDGGNLLRDSEGDVICNRKEGQNYAPQASQNDTETNGVWVALRKDIESFGQIMPNRKGLLLPKGNEVDGEVVEGYGDKFVLLNINLPEEYITAAEGKLEKALLDYMQLNNEEKFTFSVKMSRIFFAEEKNQEILEYLSENSSIIISYNEDINELGKVLNETGEVAEPKNYKMYISSYSYKVQEGEILPEISVTLTDTLAISQNAIQRAMTEVKAEILSVVSDGQAYSPKTAFAGTTTSSLPNQTQQDRNYIRKDINDSVDGVITFNNGLKSSGNVIVDGDISSKNLKVEEKVIANEFNSNKYTLGEFIENIRGGAFYLDDNDLSHIDVDYMHVRLKAVFENLVAKQTETIGGEVILSPAGSITCTGVVEKEDEEGKKFYRCYFQTEQDGEETFKTTFVAGDLAYSKTFNISNGSTAISRSYWRKVVGVGDNYIDLSKTECLKGSTAPMAGDVICQLGSGISGRNNAIIFSTVNNTAPSITLYYGITDFSLEGKAMIEYGVKDKKAFFNTYGDSYIGDKKGKHYVAYDSFNETLTVKGKFIVESGSEWSELDDKLSEYDTLLDNLGADIGEVQQQADKRFEIWYGEGTPYPQKDDNTEANSPAEDWLDEATKALHVQDLYFDITREAASASGGRAWRWTAEEITDEVGNALNIFYWKEVTDQDTVDALDKIRDVASDGVLSGGAEKSRVLIEWMDAVESYQRYEEQAVDFGLDKIIVEDGDNDYTLFVSAFIELAKYLNGGEKLGENDGVFNTPTWLDENNLHENTVIDAETYRNSWIAYYTKLATIRKAISAKSKELADQANTDIESMLSDKKVDPAEKIILKRDFMSAWHEMVDEEGLLDKCMDESGALLIDSSVIQNYETYFNSLGKLFNHNEYWDYSDFNDDDSKPCVQEIEIPSWFKSENMGTTEDLDDAQSLQDAWTGFYTARASVYAELSNVANANANNALTTLDGYASDGILMPNEKRMITRQFSEVSAEKEQIIAAAFAVAIDSLPYQRAYEALNQYLSTLKLTTEEPTEIRRSQFNLIWSEYYKAYAALALKLSEIKIRVFVSDTIPTPPYAVGDLWMKGSTEYYCVKAKGNGEVADMEDWMLSAYREPTVLFNELAQIWNSWRNNEKIEPLDDNTSYFSIHINTEISTGDKIGDLKYKDEVLSKWNSNGSWETVSGYTKLDELIHAVYTIYGSKTLRFFNVQPTEPNELDLLVEEFFVNLKNPTTQEELTPISCGVGISIYLDSSWIVLSESTKALFSVGENLFYSIVSGINSVSGVVAQDNFVEIFSEAVGSEDIDGRDIKASIIAGITDENGKLSSEVEISADNIELTGNDSISMMVTPRGVKNYAKSPLGINTLDIPYTENPHTRTIVVDEEYGEVLQVSSPEATHWQAYSFINEVDGLKGNYATLFAVIKNIGDSSYNFGVEGYYSLSFNEIELNNGWKIIYSVIDSDITGTFNDSPIFGINTALGTFQLYAIGIVYGQRCPTITEINTSVGLYSTGINIQDKTIELRGDKVKFTSSDGSVTDYKIWIDPTDGTLHAVDGMFSGNVTATSGYIGGWSIEDSHLEAKDNDVYLLASSSENNFVKLGLFDYENNESVGFTNKYSTHIKMVSEQSDYIQIGTYYDIQNTGDGGFNFAFNGYGNGILQGSIASSLYSKREVNGELGTIRLQKGKTVYGIENEGGLRQFIFCQANSALGLPQLSDVQNFCNLPDNTPFSVPLTIISGKGYDNTATLTIYGRTETSFNVNGTTETPFDTEDYPVLLNNNAGDRVKIDLAAGDIVNFLLVYDPNNYDDNSNNKYLAYITSVAS